MLGLFKKLNAKGEWRKVSQLAVGMEIAVPRRSAADVELGVGRLSHLPVLPNDQAVVDDLDSNVAWDEIVSIEHIGEERVYDIEVEGTHNFVGNNIFAHNTAIFGGGVVSMGTTTAVSGTQLFVQGQANNTPLNVASSSGSTLLTVTAAGNVGIGTTSPTQLLQVGTTLAVDNVNGRIGIGTATPSFDIGLYRLGGVTIGVEQAPSTGQGLTISGGAANTSSSDQPGGALILSGGSGQGTGSSAVLFKTAVGGASGSTTNAPAEAMRIQGSNVGIGLTAPAYTLDVKGSGTANPFNIASSSGTSLMAVLRSGNLGLGTTTPIAALQVTGPSINETGASASITRGLYVSPNPLGTANVLQGVDYRALETSGYTFNLASTTAATQIYGTLHNQITVNTTTVATLANASNVYINGAPKSTSNLTITSSTALTIIGGAVSTTTNAYGLFLTAPTGATNNYAAVFNGGNVGIGSTSPTALLAVQGSSGSATDLFNLASSTAVSQFIVKSSGNVGIGLTNPAAKMQIALNNGAAATAPTTVDIANSYLQLGFTEYNLNSYRLIGFGYAPAGNVYAPAYMGYQETSLSGFTKGDLVFGTRNVTTDSAPSEAMRITSAGNVGIGTTTPAYKLTVGSTCTVTGTNSCVDIAELINSSEPVESGDVVAVDATASSTVRRAAFADRDRPFGVVSTNPAIVIEGSAVGLMNGSYKIDPTHPAVALGGRVPVKVSNENGNIQAGDYLTVSSQFVGYAAKAVYSGNVLGLALEDFSGDPTLPSGASGPSGGKILVFVQPHYQNINNTFVLGEADGQLANATTTAATNRTNTTDKTYSFLINQKGTGNILQLQQNGADRFLVANDGSVQILANACVGDGAHQQGPWMGAVSGCNVLTVANASTTLFSISAVGDITTVGHLTVGRDTAGTAIMKAGNNQATVAFNLPYASVPKVVVTAQGVPSFFYGVTEKSAAGFTFSASAPVIVDTAFDWVALAQPQATESQSSYDLSVASSPTGSTGQISPIGPIGPISQTSSTSSPTSTLPSEPSVAGASTVDSSATSSSTPISTPSPTPAAPPPTTSTGSTGSPQAGSGSSTDLSGGATPANDIPVGSQVGPSVSPASEAPPAESSPPAETASPVSQAESPPANP